jgi:Fur family transcriptional regulator, zinc uptake regulator
MPHAFSHHDHAACAGDLLERAERLCDSSQAGRLTPLRRRTLEILAEKHRPLGAYELLERLSADGRKIAPTTVYRTLDFLVAQGLVHRLQSRNAFVACATGHHEGEVVVFLLCEACGEVAESEAAHLGSELARLASAAGFAPHAQIVELEGVCSRCAECRSS